MNPAGRVPPFTAEPSPGLGGTWPAAFRSVPSGPFLFHQLPQQLEADIPDVNEATSIAVRVARPRARRPIGGPIRPAESRPLVSPHTDDLAHGLASVAGDAEAIRVRLA